jgi:hypothetical protein
MVLRRTVVLLAIFSTLLFSCEAKSQQVQFPVRGTGQQLSTMSPEAARGWLDFSAPQKLEYQFDASPEFSFPAVSFELEYSIRLSPSVGTERPRIVLETGNMTWVLPGPADLINDDTIYHYAIPVDRIFPVQFSITLEDMENKNMTKKNEHGLQIRSVEFKERWFGFERLHDASGDHWHGSPFIYISLHSNTWVLDMTELAKTELPELPAGYFPVLSATLSPPDGE